jgi:sugar phosphate isomerase/epimerase
MSEAVAMITDIHGNLTGLEAALARIDELGIGEIYCGGDLVGYGPWPNEVCELIQEPPESLPIHSLFTGSAEARRTFESMSSSDPTAPSRLGLSIPYDWWPAAPILKEIEAAGFASVQVPAPPPSVLVSPRDATRHAAALAEALGTAGLHPLLHGPGAVRAGTRDGDLALEGLISYAAEVGASHVVYHAANLPDEPASEDARLAETRSLAALAGRAERLGVIIALENLAPVYPSPDALSFTPLILRTMAQRISSPAVGLCLDVGHANIVAALRRTDPLDLIEPVLDRAVIFHLHDNLGARRGDTDSPEIDPLRLDLHLPPGRGSVPWDRLAPLLARKRAAPLVLEVHPPRPSAARLFEAGVAVVAPPAVPAVA